MGICGARTTKSIFILTTTTIRLIFPPLGVLFSSHSPPPPVRHAEWIGIMDNLEIAIVAIVITINWETIRPDGDGSVLPDNSDCVQGMDAAIASCDVHTMQDLKVPVAAIPITHDRQTPFKIRLPVKFLIGRE
jgi:hypothetical protein